MIVCDFFQQKFTFSIHYTNKFTIWWKSFAGAPCTTDLDCGFPYQECDDEKCICNSHSTPDAISWTEERGINCELKNGRW